jgi:alkanesulfonate monooxygenase SsuD/methylene tetrahydromethanopterin reductase-like flavin-dependent oxidoreductase (luciferase family)
LPATATTPIWLNLSFVDPGRFVEQVRLAEELGLAGIQLGEHLLAPPANDRSPYPYRGGVRGWEPTTAWPDLWVTFAVLAQQATSLRFCSSITILPARDVLSVGKAIATADVLSGGRMALGAGTGWLKEDYELVGKDFARRGHLLDRCLADLRSLLDGSPLEISTAAGPVAVELTAPRPAAHVPFYIGGSSPAAYRRAARHDGWLGSQVTDGEVARAVAAISAERQRIGRDGHGEVIVALSGEPELDRLRRACEDGATGLVIPAARLAGGPAEPGYDDALRGLVRDLR